MSTLTTYGRKKPESSDDSQVWMENLEYNIDINDAHTHDGVDSVKLTSADFDKESVVAYSTGNWVGSDGAYTLTITATFIPSKFRLSGTSSSELCKAIVLDSDNDDVECYAEQAWTSSGATAQLVLTSTVAFNCKILFI